MGAALVWVLLAACGGGSDERPEGVIDGRALNVADLWGVWVQVEDPEARGFVIGFEAPGKFSMYDGREPIEEAV